MGDSLLLEAWGELSDPWRGLTMYQPWAAAVAELSKHYETRSWSTRYRGPLAIHAGRERRHMAAADRLFLPPPSQKEVIQVERPAMSLGAIVAVGWLNACTHTEDMFGLSDEERALGDYGPGRFAWQIINVIPLVYPVPVIGARGLWKLQPETQAQVMTNLMQQQLDPLVCFVKDQRCR